MSSQAPPASEDRSSLDAAAVAVASVAIVVAMIGLAYRPALVTPLAIILALIAGGMSVRRRTFAAAAVTIAGLAWFVGMTIALFANTRLF
jgi:hypothetical protein